MSFLIISILIISIVGTLGHFLYDLTNHNKFIGIFAAVNESTWEHIKIALTPSLLWGIVDGFLYGTNPNYFFAKVLSLITIIILMPLLFYGHRLISKKDSLVFDIIIFYIVIICSQLVFNYIINMSSINFIIHYISCIVLFIIFGFYMIFTLFPLKNFIFKDPITNKYGYKAHSNESNFCKDKKD